jgi:hypothetical protein
MNKLILEEIKRMTLLSNYDTSRTLSEQSPPPEEDVPDEPELSGENWDDVVNYYSGNTDSNWKFVNYSDDTVVVNSTDTNDADATMYFTIDGRVTIYDKGLGTEGTGRSFGEWEWDGTKPVIKFKGISKNASGYVQQTDTDWSAVTENNKIIGLNAKGPLVKQVQNKLIFFGYSGTSSGTITTDVAGCGDDVEKCDGIYGKMTKEMVKQYQTDNGLSVDGIVGKQTYYAMDIY